MTNRPAGTDLANQPQPPQRVIDLHATLDEAKERLYGVAMHESWKPLGYPDWDTYVRSEVLPRLLDGPEAYELLAPSLAVLPKQHADSDLATVVNGLLNQARRLLATAPREGLQVWEKQVDLGGGRIHRSPVTGLDLMIQQLLLEGLNVFYDGDIRVYAEEGDASHHAPEALDQPPCVVIDPIDRTKELVLGRRGYSINVAVITPTGVRGWTDFPGLNWRFAASPRGLWFNGEYLTAPVPPWPGNFQLAVNPAQARWLGDNLGGFRLGGEDGPEVFWHVSGGVTYRLALLALGKVQAVWIPPTPFPRFALYDWLAIGAGLERLGLVVEGWEPGVNLLQRRPATWGGGLLAGTLEACQQLRGLLPDRLPGDDAEGAITPTPTP